MVVGATGRGVGRGCARLVELRLTPEQAFAAWPKGVALAAMWSGGPVEPTRTRWTVLARPSGESGWPGAGLIAAAQCDPQAPPFQGGWIGVLEYELGVTFEPKAGPGQRAGAARWFRCDDALIYDRLERRWWAVGDPPELSAAQANENFTVGPTRLTVDANEYESRVARVLEYIRAGDVYQVNLAHHIEAEFGGCARAFFLALAASAEPWYGAYVETPSGAVCSASPELFLSYDPRTRRLGTRPMKGTRRAAAGRAALEGSPKDTAELTMITDLMRNDLGRICELGSVVVERRRDLEQHATSDAALFQATATVVGTLRAGATLRDVFAATFPGGSIIGAPKIRAMQIISELEKRPRGVYCGSIGFISDSGDAAFNIAIRTASISEGIISYGVGAGIVADSDPAAEWRETLDKARVFLNAAGVGVGAVQSGAGVGGVGRAGVVGTGAAE
jgi:para-aminobenzoate synthetase component I